MIPIIVENSRIPKLLSIIIEINAITLWPFIIFRNKSSERVLRHEMIHIKQYNEMFVIGFLIIYLYDWLKGLIKYKDKEMAYYRIRFEQEAYMYDIVDGYLETRKKYAWRDYNV